MNITEIKSSKIYIVESLSDITFNVTDRVVYAKDSGNLQYYDGETYVNTGPSIKVYETLPTDVSSEGNLIYVSSDEQLYVSTGTEWKVSGGSSINIYSSATDLPSDAEEGDVAITSDTDAFYYYNGSSWSSGDIFEDTTPVPVDIGGIEAGTDISTWNIKKVVQRIVLPEMDPTVGTPSNTLSLGYSSTTLEVGTELDLLGIYVTFNKSTIAPYYDSTGKQIYDSVVWAGDATKYTITSAVGLTDKAGTYTVGTDTGATATSLSISGLTRDLTWGGVKVIATTTYAAGSYVAYTSYGNIYKSPTASTTSSATINITSSLPYYATSSNIDILTRQTSSVTNINGTITSTITIGSSGTSGLVAESPGGGKQALLLPSNWLTGSFTMKQYDTVSGSYKTADASQFTVIDGTDLELYWSSNSVSWDGGSKTISGNAPIDTTQDYKLLLYNSDTSGVRTIQITRS